MTALGEPRSQVFSLPHPPNILSLRGVLPLPVTLGHLRTDSPVMEACPCTCPLSLGGLVDTPTPACEWPAFFTCLFHHTGLFCVCHLLAPRLNCAIRSYHLSNSGESPNLTWHNLKITYSTFSSSARLMCIEHLSWAKSPFYDPCAHI